MAQAENDGAGGPAGGRRAHYAEAQTHFETALKIYPSYSPPMDGLATILSLHQRYDEALVLYERAVKVWPGSFASVTNWAGLLWDRATTTQLTQSGGAPRRGQGRGSRRPGPAGGRRVPSGASRRSIRPSR